MARTQWRRPVAAVLALLAVLPMVVPLLWVGARFAWQPHPTLGALLDVEQPLTIRPFEGLWAVVGAAAWFALAYRSRRGSWWEGGLVVLGAVPALLRLGNIWVFALALLVPLARQVWLARPSRLVAAAVGVALVAVTLYAGLSTRPAPLPVAAAEALGQAQAGPVFAAQPWASEVASRLPAGSPVLGTGDPWTAPADYWIDYQRISLAHVSWTSLLDRYGVRTLVLDSEGSQRRAAEFVRQPGSGWRVRLDRDGVLVADRALE